MDRLDVISLLCGLVAVLGVGLVGMSLGYDDLSFSKTSIGRLALCLAAELPLMWWMGPAPALLVTAPLQALAKGWPRSKAWAEGLFAVLRFPLILATAVGLALLLLRFIRSGFVA